MPIAPILLAAASPLFQAQEAPPLPSQASPERHPSAVRHAGIYHVATGTWTRQPTTTASLGPDVVYDNTAYSGYFTSAATVGGFFGRGAVIDEGGLPGPSNGHSFPVAPDRDAYWIRSIEIGYCDGNQPGTSGWKLEFYEAFEPCEFQPALIPDATIEVTGLPASGGCWTVEIDLTGGSEFALGADGGAHHPGWDDDPARDSFGWSVQYLGPGNEPAGFMLAGDPLSTDPGFAGGQGFSLVTTAGTGTYYGPASLCGDGTGYLTRDIMSFRPETGTGYGSCNSFFYRNVRPCTAQNGPLTSSHLRLTADTGAVPGGWVPRSCSETFGPGTPYCTTTRTSAGREGFLCMSGSAVASDDDARLNAARLPTGSFGFFITSRTQGFVQNPGGSRGHLCLGGDIGRFVAPHQIKQAGVTGTFTLDTRLGEWSVDSIPFSSGNYAGSAGETTYFQAWFRDTWNQQPTSNFTTAYAVTWQ